MVDPLPTNDQEAPWRARHEAILESASRLLATAGPSGLTMQRIAEEAGFSVGYLYRHFPGKKELLAELLDHKLGAFFMAGSGVTAATAGSPLRALRRRIRVAMDRLDAERHLVPMLMTLAKAYPQKVRRRKDPLARQDEALFRQAMEAGEIRPDDPAHLAAAYNGMIWGLIHLWNREDRLENIRAIPQLVDDLLLQPLQTYPDLPRKDEPGELENCELEN